MAYNTLCGTVNFCDDSGSIESMVDDYSNQTIAGVKTFSSPVTASTFYDSTLGAPLTPAALSAIASDGAKRVIVSDGDGTATCYSTLTYDGVTLTASVSGSAAALHSIPLGPTKVAGNLSASNIYFGDGLQNSANKIAAQGGSSIMVDGTGINVDLATTGGLAHDGGKLRVNPNDATAKASLSNNDKILISDVDASNVLKNATLTVLGTYMQNTLTFPGPGGLDSQIQYRSGGNFTGNSNLTYNGTNTLTTINVSASGHVSSSLFVGDGSGLVNVAAGTPAGINQNIQFNSGSSFSGSSNLNFIYDGLVNVLQTVGDVSASNDFTGGRDLILKRDAQIGRDVVVTGQVSASQNVSGAAFYGHGNTLTTAPINNYQNTRLVLCGTATDTIDTFAGLTWSNPLLSVPGSVSVTSNISASGHVSASTFVGDGAGLTGVTAEWDGSHNGNASITGSLYVTAELSASGEASLGAVDIFNAGVKVAYLSGSGEISGSTMLATSGSLCTLHLSGAQGTEALRIAKGAADTREIVFENDGTDIGSIFMNAAEALIIKNESNNDDIIFQTKPAGVATNALTVDGPTANIGIGTVAPEASLQISGSDSVELLHIGADSNDDIFIVSGSGTVGISTPSPRTALDVRWNPVSLADNTGGGDAVLFGTGTLTAGKLYYLHTDGAWTEVDADAVATGADQMLGIALGADPSVDGVLIRGFFDATTYLSNFSAGKAIYVSTTAASMDTTAPSAAGDFVRIVGYCTNTTNVIYFNPSSEWIELA